MSLLGLIIVLGFLSLIFGLWTVIGLSRQNKRAVSKTRKKKWFLGVCADFSQYVGIPLWIVRLYAILFAPFILGIVFYLMYYLVIRNRKEPQKPQKPKKPLQITQMESHHYRRSL